MHHLCDFCKVIKHFCAETFHMKLGLAVKMFICFHFNNHFMIKMQIRMLEQVGGPSQIIQSEVLTCDSERASLCQPYGKVSVSSSG